MMQPISSAPSRPLSLPLSAWPTTDRDRWAAALEPCDLLVESSPASRWSVIRKKDVERFYGCWLAWLSRHGLLCCQTQPSDRLTIERLGLYRTELSTTHAAASVVMMVQGLAAMMHAIEPDKDWAWLKKATLGLRRWSASKTPIVRRTVPIQDLIGLGFDLMEKRATKCRGPVDAAAIYRDGLMIALLAQRPMRRSNLCQIELGKHLVVIDDRAWLSFAAEETKTGRSLEFSWPENLEFHLQHYVDLYRPRLLAGRTQGSCSPGSALWISRVGTALSPISVCERIVGHTRKQFGFSINPHHFRACVATHVAENDPEHIYIAATLLGHANLSTTHKHYIRATGLSATREHATVITALRNRRTAHVWADGRKPRVSSQVLD